MEQLHNRKQIFKTKLTALIIMLALAGAVILLWSTKTTYRSQYESKAISVGGHRINVYVADTEAKRELGLAAFADIADDQGMIFYFDQPGIYPFWMKNMKFSIDIIWVRDGKIVDIDQSIKPEPDKDDDKLQRYIPSSEVDCVIEIKTGWVQNNNISTGDIVRIGDN